MKSPFVEFNGTDGRPSVTVNVEVIAFFYPDGFTPGTCIQFAGGGDVDLFLRVAHTYDEVKAKIEAVTL
jgi:hypothetical protein